METVTPLNWKKFARIVVVCGLLLTLSDCARFFPKTGFTSTYHRGCSAMKVWQACPVVSPTGLPGTIRPDVPAFHSVVVAGPYNVALRPSRGGHDVVIHGDASVIGRTHTYVKDGKLFIRAEGGVAYGNNNRANVDIRMGVLSKIVFDSPGTLVATGIRSTRLMVVASHKAKVRLAGSVRNLDVATYEQARVDTKDLKVKKNLSAAAKGTSRLYHYAQPQNRNAHPQPAGAVVRMGGLKLEPVCKKPPCQTGQPYMPKELFEDGDA